MIKIKEPGALGFTYIFESGESIMNTIGPFGYQEAYEVYRMLGNEEIFLIKSRRRVAGVVLSYNQVPFFLNRRMKRA